MEKLKISKIEGELEETLKVWPIASKVLSTLETEEQYLRAVKQLDELIDIVSKKPDSIKESLIDTMGTLIKDYEDRHIPKPEGDPIGCLKYLMEEHNLKQTDLNELGSQGVVSEILSRKRRLNIRQIKALSQRFHVSPSVFI